MDSFLHLFDRHGVVLQRSVLPVSAGDDNLKRLAQEVLLVLWEGLLAPD
jgi:hypothetical protein